MRVAALLAAGLAACATTATEGGGPLVDAAGAVPGLRLDMRYVGNENFVGRPITGYDAARCLLTEGAATALAEAQAELAAFGLGLKVFDCYRPQRAVDDFARWAEDLSDTKMKAAYYPAVPKSELFARGYIAARSGHSRGSTVDLTIVDAASGEELDMGSPYDLFDPLSWPSDPRPSDEARSNRMLLQRVMTNAGFRPLREEWWHFTLENEPYPDQYFDIPIR